MRLFILLLIILLTSCANATLESELAVTKSALINTEAALKDANQQLADLQKAETGQLVHVVFFKVKEGTEADMITAIKKLEGIPVVKDLEVGTFENLNDPRALAEYNLMMEMSFTDKVAYEIYQKHPLHIALKENTKSFMVGPPATYDFIEK